MVFFIDFLEHDCIAKPRAYHANTDTRQPNTLPYQPNKVRRRQTWSTPQVSGHGSNSSSSSTHASRREACPPLGDTLPGLDTPKPSKRMGWE